MKLSILKLIVLAFSLVLAGCGTNSSEKASKNAEQKVLEKDIELTDESQKQAAEAVKLFLKDVYSNNEFSEGVKAKGSDWLMEGEDDFKESLKNELIYITSNGTKPLTVENVYIKEVTEVPGFPFNNETYSKSFIINSKIIFKETESDNNYKLSGNIASLNKNSNKWEITWFNLPQKLEKITWANGNNYVRVVPKNDDESAALELASQLAKGFVNISSRKSIDDTEGLENLWVDSLKEGFKNDVLSTNQSIMNALPKENYPEVNRVEPNEIQMFKETPIENASVAYTVNLVIEYKPNKALDIDELNVVVAKINNEWKVYQFNGERVVPWTFVDRSK